MVCMPSDQVNYTHALNVNGMSSTRWALQYQDRVWAKHVTRLGMNSLGTYSKVRLKRSARLLTVLH